MRSRYSAYVVHNADYLLQTWHSDPRPGRIDFDADQRWTGLEIVGTSGGGMLEPTGTVEFRAAYTRRGVPGEQHELSSFVRESGNWVYRGEA
jgi:SEC-C motif-containing protein